MKSYYKGYKKENNLRCRLLGHKWLGCSCRICGTVRDQEHKWAKFSNHEKCGEKCSRCNKEKLTPHDFKHLLNECYKQCRNCGYKTNVDHTWNYCVCSVCGKKQDYNHNFVGPDCSRVCSICGKEESHPNGNNKHDWVITGCEARCSKCGKKQPAHAYQLIRHDVRFGTGKCPKADKNDDYICGYCDTPDACMQYPRVDTFEYRCTRCGHIEINDSEQRDYRTAPDTYNNEIPVEAP